MGTWLKGLPPSHTAHEASRTGDTYRKASCAQVPSLTSCTLEAHWGSLEARVTEQGAGRGWQPQPDVPAAQAGPVCPAVLGGPAGSKALGGGEGTGRPFPEEGPTFPPLGSTPLPGCRWGHEGDWLLFLKGTEASWALRGPGGVWGPREGARGHACLLLPHTLCTLSHSHAFSHSHSQPQSSFSLSLTRASSGERGVGEEAG